MFRAKFRKKHWIWLGAISLILGFGFYYFQYIDEALERRYWNSPERKKVVFDTQVLSKFHTGDLIFRRGFGGISNLIAAFAQTGPHDVTHVGILLRDGQDRWFVTHAVSNKYRHFDGVVIEPISSFLSESEAGKVWVFRSGEARERQRQLIWRAARNMRAQGIKFDAKWDWEDASEVYCSEYVVRVLMDSAAVMPRPKELDSLKYMYLDLGYLYGRCQLLWPVGEANQ